MLDIIYSSQFKRDYKKCIQRKLDIDLLKQLIAVLSIPEKLPPKNQDHALKGNYKNRRECHVAPDWLLIYEIYQNKLYLDRTGTHSDLFKK